MNYAQHQLYQLACAVEADNCGRPIQCQNVLSGEWEDTKLSALEHVNMGRYIRPKAEPVTVPWSKPEHVPGPVCWIRNKGNVFVELIVEVSSDGIKAGSNDDIGTWEDCKHWEHSTDRVNWKPCTVTQ